MSTTQIYQDPIIKKYVDLIKLKNTEVKSFYYGDPIKIPVSALPACVISKNETRVGHLTNSEDEHGIALILTVVTDIRKTINDDKELAAGISQLYDIIEGREAATLKLKDTCILDILRNNVLVDASNGLRTDLGTITRADYGMTVGKRDNEAWAIEASVEFIAHFTQLRN